MDSIVVNTDSIRLMTWLVAQGGAKGMVDAILTDPPYKLSRPDMTKPDGSVLTRDFGEDQEDLPVHELAVAFDHLLTKDGSILVWCADHQVTTWLEALSDRMDKVMTGGWIKTNPAPNMRRRTWTSTLELWVWGARGDWMFNWPGHRAGFNTVSGPHLAAGEPEYTGHPNQKPLAIVEPHVRVMTRPGDLVLDPFAGSGSYVVAAHRMGRRAVGFELEEDRALVAQARLRTVVPQAELFQEETPRRRPSKRDQADLFREMTEGGRG